MFFVIINGTEIAYHTCNQENKHIEQYCALIYALNSMKEYEVKQVYLKF